MRPLAGRVGPHLGQLRDQHSRVRHGREHGERFVRVRGRVRVRHVLREHHRGAIRSPGAGSLGPGEEVAVHVARLVREIRHVSPVPRRHVGRGPSRLRRGQRGLLDADTGGEGAVGVRGLGPGQDRADDDHGARDQGRRLQVRHAGEELHGPRRETGAYPAGRPEGLHHQAQTHVPFHQDKELRRLGLGPLLRPLPGIQVPGLDGGPLPMHHTDMPLPVPGAMLRVAPSARVPSPPRDPPPPPPLPPRFLRPPAAHPPPPRGLSAGGGRPAAGREAEEVPRDNTGSPEGGGGESDNTGGLDRRSDLFHRRGGQR